MEEGDGAGNNGAASRRDVIAADSRLQVCEKVEQKVRTTYNEVADELVRM